MTTLATITDRHVAWLQRMGWVGNLTPLEMLALITSEVGEAVQECRGAQPTAKLPSELADIILRTLALAREQGYDMDAAIAAKMEANEARGSNGRLK